jgi:hypothetical protein
MQLLRRRIDESDGQDRRGEVIRLAPKITYRNSCGCTP